MSAPYHRCGGFAGADWLVRNLFVTHGTDVLRLMVVRALADSHLMGKHCPSTTSAWVPSDFDCFTTARRWTARSTCVFSRADTALKYERPTT